MNIPEIKYIMIGDYKNGHVIRYWLTLLNYLGSYLKKNSKFLEHMKHIVKYGWI